MRRLDAPAVGVDRFEVSELGQMRGADCAGEAALEITMDRLDVHDAALRQTRFAQQVDVGAAEGDISWHVQETADKRWSSPMTDPEMLDAIYWKLVAFLKPNPGVPADETCLQIMELFERNGREFIKVNYPAND